MLVGVVGIERGPGIQRVRLDQVYVRRRLAVSRAGQARAPDVDAVLVAPDHDAQALQRFDARGLELVALDLRVKRHEQPHIVAARGQLARQGAGHVGEAAGLGERHDFGGDGADREFHGGGHSSD